MLQFLDIFNAPTPITTALETTRFAETEEAWVVEIDMPGVAKENIQVQVSGNYLDVKGERSHGDKTYLYKEKFRLPFPVKDTSGIVAASDLGVLKITLPKTLAGLQSQLIAVS